MSVVYCFFVSFMLSLVLFILGHVLPLRNSYMEKKRPYECGFDPINSSRIPFSFRFFLVAVLFLIFDLEIVLLIPYVSGVSNSPGVSMLVFFFFFGFFDSGVSLWVVKSGVSLGWVGGSVVSECMNILF